MGVALVSEFAPFRADQNAGGWASDSSWRALLRARGLESASRAFALSEPGRALLRARGLEYARERARGKA